MTTTDVLYSDDPLEVYFREVNKVHPLDAVEEAQCVKLARASGNVANAARTRLLEANLHHVIATAELKNDRAYILDLIEQGNAGLIAALNNLGQFTDGPFWEFARAFVEHAIDQAADSSASEK